MSEITFNNPVSGYPMRPNRIKFETDLVKSANSPKLAQELPVSDFSQKAIVEYSRYNKLAAIRHGDAYYLFDRRQISEPEVRKRLAAGQVGTLLGYSEDSEPDEGQQVAISVDGEYSEIPNQILEWMDNDNLGLTWKASDNEAARAIAAKHLGG